MIRQLVIAIGCISCVLHVAAQDKPLVSCGEKDITQALFNNNPAIKQLHEQIENRLLEYRKAVNSGTLPPQAFNTPVTLPVVVHIIHNNGPENISDAQVFAGIQDLNNAFASSGYYAGNGVNTNIQFCMAQRDPANNTTNGITRNVSTYTVMGGAAYYSDDQNVKNINRWNPGCYINIWLVRSIPGNTTGYAYLPFAHGTNIDGIVVEASFFGSSYANDAVIAHQMGHYLGLYHTFEGGCTNNDCSVDGDKVCDTPPDQTTAATNCNQVVNSCSTDALSGFSTDVNDLTQDFMDYGNLKCMKVFTQGQADRMNWFISNVRGSLLTCRSCMAPCPSPVTANFTIPTPISAGVPASFTNTSVNAASWQWYVNGVLQSSGGNLTYTFPNISADTIRLVAQSGNSACMDNEKSVIVQALCPAKASFTHSAASVGTGATINFTNTSTNANTYQWFVDGVAQSTTTNFSYTTTIGGKHVVKLVAANTTFGCEGQFTDTVTYNCSQVVSFTPAPAYANVGQLMVFNGTSPGATHWHWYVNGVAVGSDSAALIYTFPAQDTFTVQLSVDNGTCTASAVNYVYVGNQCNNPSGVFQKSYAQGDYSEAQSISATSDGGCVLTEWLQLTPNDVINYSAVMKLDATGNVSWATSFAQPGATILSQVRQTSDGGYIVVGGTNSGNSLLIVKMDAGGNKQWSTEWAVGSYNEAADIIQGTDGNYYFVTQGGYSGVVAGALDNTGALIWIKSYFIKYEDAASVAQDGNFIILAGDTYNGKGNGILLKVQKSNGNLVWAKEYAATDEFFEKVLVASDGYYVLGEKANTTTTDFSDYFLLKTDFNGNLLWSKYQEPFGLNIDFVSNDVLLKGNGNLAFMLNKLNNDTLYVQEINPSGVLVAEKRYDKNAGTLLNFAKRADEGLFLVGYLSKPVAPTYRNYVVRLDPSGNAGNCPPVTVTGTLLNFTPTVTTLSPTVTSYTPTPITNHTAVPVAVNAACELANCNPLPVLPPDTCGTCTTAGISGPAGICDKSANYTYQLKRNGNCPAVSAWAIDPAFASVVSTTDSTIVLHFTGNGSAVLHSTLTARCKVWLDSVRISIFSPSGTLNLGPDVALCTSSIYTLHAGNSFASYRWQDGSADSSFTVYNPGTYYVEAADLCGNLSHDTVVITQAPNIPFNINHNMVVCKQDTVAVTAPAGFVKYYWAPNYNIDNRYAAGINIVGNTDTLYTVVAEKAPGCVVVDTVHLKINLPTPVALGNDTSICKLDSITIDAGSGFSSYMWNTGALTESIRAGAAGQYSVVVTNSINCKSRDTLQIISLYPLPLVDLGPDKAICSDTSVVFDAGSGMTAYTWQDGSTNATFTAVQPGTYWVHVTDANGCHNADTVLITGFKISPSGFLPKDTSLCFYQTLVVQATGDFVQYQWSDNSTGSSIVVNTAGDYWLRVIDTAGCAGTDTIHISTRDCTRDVFLPNAFTPGTGTNNLFRAVVHGDLENFRLSVFNRFGQAIFTTQDPLRGWDGTYNGMMQDTGTFVWFCTFKLIGPGQVQTTKRGTVTLIR